MVNHRPCRTASRLLLSLLAPFSVLPAIGQTAADPLPEGRLQYTGDLGQFSLGYVNGGYFQGELSGVLSEGVSSAWLAEGWVQRSAGGAKLSYHQATDETIHKYFLALDRNDTADRKLTVGAGIERPDWFGNVSLSRGISDRRLLQQSSSSTVTELSGTEGGRNYVDSVTRVVTTRLFERAYDYGLGLRAGHYFDESNIRVTTGIDYEWGSSNAQQTSVSLMAEKYFVGTPHSLAIQLDLLRKSGDFEIERDNTRVMLSYRYSFGAKNTRPERLFRMIPSQGAASSTVTAAPAAANPSTVIPAHTESKMVLTKATMTSDAFFEFASAKLTPVARAELDKIAETLKAGQHEGNVRIVGHTCDLGPEKYNLRLSMMRATAVRDYLVATGAFAADAAILEGKGSAEPKYAPKAETRSKNRRVELEFVSLTEKEELVEIPAKTIPGAESVASPDTTQVTYQREVIEQEPAWLRRALRTPAVHKRTVDVYRSQEQTQTETVSRSWVNRAPIAQSDSYSVADGSSTVLAVLANDNDPDTGDTLSVSSVSAAAKGQVRLDGNQVIYVAPVSYSGQDSFTYVVKDSHGASSTATVQIQVTQPNHVPNARNDFYTVGWGVNTPLNVLANDSDPDGDPLTIVSLTQPAGGNGNVEISGSQIIFMPHNRFTVDSFTYTVSDGKGGTSTATVQLIDP
jgi:outer membrane protein OmpA-like peptidoglycan-associated protein